METAFDLDNPDIPSSVSTDPSLDAESNQKILKELEEAKSYFKCSCGYEDYMGNAEGCPICEPKEEQEDTCFFLDEVKGLCRQDATPCPYLDSDKDYAECERLEKPVFPKKASV
jgi:hypothetical protein